MIANNKSAPGTVTKGAVYLFTKSGNPVRAIEPAPVKRGQPAEWVVERVDGASVGKRMLVRESSLEPPQ